MTLVRMARWTEDFTLDFAPGVRLGERDGVSGSFCLGSEERDGAYSFLNMMAVSDRCGCHGRGNSLIELTRWAFFEASSRIPRRLKGSGVRGGAEGLVAKPGEIWLRMAGSSYVAN
jgi:hypothetical protein